MQEPVDLPPGVRCWLSAFFKSNQFCRSSKAGQAFKVFTFYLRLCFSRMSTVHCLQQVLNAPSRLLVRRFDNLEERLPFLCTQSVKANSAKKCDRRYASVLCHAAACMSLRTHPGS